MRNTLTVNIPAPQKVEPIPEDTLLARVSALVAEEMALLWGNADNGFQTLSGREKARFDAIQDELAATWDYIRRMRAPAAHYAKALPDFMQELAS